MEVDELHARAAVKAGKCDGNCEVHRGEVKLVTVGGWGHFAYCEAAVEEDKSRGLVVETAEHLPSYRQGKPPHTTQAA